MAAHEIDMCRGPIGSMLLKFLCPLLLTDALQRCFLLADLFVIGRFADFRSLAAVGAVTHASMLVVDLFIGIAAGTGVVAAQAYGAGDLRHFSQVVRTAIIAAWWSGVALMALGGAVSYPLLKLLNTPEDILGRAFCYQTITFVGMPFQMVSYVGFALLRAVGDTRRPLVILTVSGALNLVLNILLVAVFHLDVAGVASATVISGVISAALLYRVMRDPHEICHLRLRGASFDWSIFWKIQKIGLPTGAQSSCFAISNMIIQASINGFGSMVVAGHTAAVGIIGFIAVANSAFHHSALTFIAQNYGGGRYHRIRSGIYWCVMCCSATGFVLGMLFWFFGPELLGIFNHEPRVIECGMIYFRVICGTYILCSAMEISGASLRGLGHSMTPAVSTLLGTCFFRILWVWLVFPHWHSYCGLISSYPVSWLLIAIFNFSVLFHLCRKLFRERVRSRRHPSRGAELAAAPDPVKSS